jgi:hypothetical protein
VGEPSDGKLHFKDDEGTAGATGAEGWVLMIVSAARSKHAKLCDGLRATVRGHQWHIHQRLAKAALMGVGRLKLVECHRPCPHEDTLYQIYIPQTTTDYHLLIVTLII